MFSGWELSVVLILLLFLFFRTRNSKSKLPGPRGLPLIGNLIDIAWDGAVHLTLQKWARKYGSIFSYKIGGTNFIVISDVHLVRDLFSKDSVSGRPRNSAWALYSKNSGIVLSDGKNWKVQRPFVMKSLKQRGYGAGRSAESLILGEVERLLSNLKSNLGRPISGNDIFFEYLAGTMWGIMSADGDYHEKQKVGKLLDSFIRAINKASNSGVMFFPSLRFIAPGYFGWTDYINSINDFRNFITKRIEQSTLKDGDVPRDFIESFLLEIRSTSDPTSTFYAESGYNNLIAAVIDVLNGSIDTTSKTLEFAMIYLSEAKDVQVAMQEELDKVVGGSRLPSLQDRAMLPYTEAVIWETLRLSSIAAIGFPHRLLEDLEFCGHVLPKDSLVLSNHYTIFRDTATWGTDVEAFRPERFLNESKTKVMRHASLIPFSVGKRQCVGETIAMDVIFLFMTCVLQKFSVELDPNTLKADLGTYPGIILAPKPFRIVLNSRQIKKRIA